MVAANDTAVVDALIAERELRVQLVSALTRLVESVEDGDGHGVTDAIELAVDVLAAVQGIEAQS